MIVARARLMAPLAGRGRMVSVQLSAAEALRVIESETADLAVAAMNGPNATVLSGERSALERAVRGLEARGVSCRWVPVDYAFHSPQMGPLRGPLVQALDGLTARLPRSVARLDGDRRAREGRGLRRSLLGTQHPRAGQPRGRGADDGAARCHDLRGDRAAARARRRGDPVPRIHRRARRDARLAASGPARAGRDARCCRPPLGARPRRRLVGSPGRPRSERPSSPDAVGARVSSAARAQADCRGARVGRTGGTPAPRTTPVHRDADLRDPGRGRDAGVPRGSSNPRTSRAPRDRPDRAGDGRGRRGVRRPPSRRGLDHQGAAGARCGAHRAGHRVR